MSIRTFLWVAISLIVASVAVASEVKFYDDEIPSSLNPLYGSSMVDRRAQELYFDRVYYTDPVTNEYKSRIVINYETASMSPFSVKLYLKPGLKWHNGNPITAKDICFTIDAMLDERTPSKSAEVYREFFRGCVVEKDLVAKVEFTQVDYNPPARLNFAILPSSEFDSTEIPPDSKFSSRPVGSGSMSGRKTSTQSHFEAHRLSPHHQPKIDRMQMMPSGDPRIQVQDVINNKMHGIVSVPPSHRPTLRASSEVSMKNYDLRSWWFIALNTNHPALAIKEVRQGLNYVLDRNELREKSTGVKKGDKECHCEFISGPFVQSSPYYNRAVPVVENSNPTKAEDLFLKAGLVKEGGFWQHEGKPITLRIGMKVSLDKEAPDLINQIGNQLSEAGIDKRVITISNDEWRTEVETGKSVEKYDMVIGKWSFGLDENVNDIFHSRTQREGKLNLFSYSNPEVDELLVQFEKARREDQAKDAYHNLHSKLAEELPYLFLWKLDTKSAWRKEVRNNLITPYYYFTVVDNWS